MAVPDTTIVGFGIRQAEFGLVKKQERRLQRLETTRIEGLAAVISAFAAAAGLSRKDARLLAATGQEEVRNSRLSSE
jgi:hypothetical protein